jgi:hypothetical protein
MDVDAKSESESEDEVRASGMACSSQPDRAIHILSRRQRNSTLQAHWNSSKRAGA